MVNKMKNIRDMSLVDLIDLMVENKDNQEVKNRIIMEITYRLYVPFKDKTFEELLVENGYREIENRKGKDL